MDKIYSRTRIRIPNIVYGKFNNNNFENEKKLKLIKIVIIFTIAILVVKLILDAINPVIETLSRIYDDDELSKKVLQQLFLMKRQQK